jgi:hypothetical protein
VVLLANVKVIQISYKIQRLIFVIVILTMVLYTLFWYWWSHQLQIWTFAENIYYGSFDRLLRSYSLQTMYLLIYFLTVAIEQARTRFAGKFLRLTCRF